MLGARRQWIQGALRIVAAPLVWLRVPPNLLTASGPFLALIPAFLAYRHDYVWAGVAVAAVSLIDMLDGAVARARGKVTAFGGYLDSVLDRVSDGILLLGVGLGLMSVTGWLLVGAGMIGQYGTSYARARVYEDARPPDGSWGQGFERPERVILLSASLLLQGLLAPAGPETRVLEGGLVAFALATNLTAALRVLKARRLLAQSHK